MSDVGRRSPGERYLAAQRSFVELVQGLGSDEWATAVPCCPGWTVRDVLSHVAGIPDDAVHGRMDGVTTPPWTAAQVERNASLAVTALLARWDEQAPGFAAMIGAIGEIRPVIDCHTHEHDVRHALDRPGNRTGELVDFAADALVSGFDPSLRLTVRLTDGRVLATGAEEATEVELRDVSAFEVFRSRLGRRSAGQVRAYDWSGSPAATERVIADWFAFGPAPTEIAES